MKMVVAVLVATVAAFSVESFAGSGERSPEATVKEYLGALKEERFDRTYELVSKAMKTDRATKNVKSKEQWVKESQYIFQFSEAKIFDFEVFAGEVEGEKAFVPNILSSQDKFLNQLGAEEYELYTLVREDGEWKVDMQQVVVDTAELTRWFPSDEGDTP